MKPVRTATFSPRSPPCSSPLLPCSRRDGAAERDIVRRRAAGRVRARDRRKFLAAPSGDNACRRASWRGLGAGRLERAVLPRRGREASPQRLARRGDSGRHQFSPDGSRVWFVSPATVTYDDRVLGGRAHRRAARGVRRELAARGEAAALAWAARSSSSTATAGAAARTTGSTSWTRRARRSTLPATPRTR